MLDDSISHGATKTEDEHRRDICAVGRRFHGRGFVASTDGNISVRLDPRHILTTPTGFSKGMMSPDDLVITDLQGKRISGRGGPSSELAMHLLIYRRRPDVNAVCHAHPPTATGYAAAGLPLNEALLAELVVGLGSVPVAPYATPGTAGLSESIEPLVQKTDAILMANHGVVTYGPDLLTAFFRMETVEHFAQVSLAVHLLGRPVLLSRENVEKLLALRIRYGISTEAKVSADSLVTGETSAPSHAPDRLTLTRAELESLIAEAIRKDRERR